MKPTSRFVLQVMLILNLFLLSCQPQKSADKEREQMTWLLLWIAFSKEALALNGTWTGSSGATNVIAAEKSIARGTQGTWTYTFSSTIIYYQVVEFDNATKTVYIKSPDEPVLTDCNGNGTNAEAGVACYNRYVWTVDSSGQYYYCRLVTQKESLDAAKADPATADASDPANSGCNGGAWIKITKTNNS